MSSMAFGPDGILLVGDAIGGAVYALDLKDRAPSSSNKVAIENIEAQIGSLLGTDASDVLVHDMAVNPISRNIYLTVSRARKQWTSPWSLPNDVANAQVLLKVTPAGEMSEVSLKAVSFSSISLPNPIDPKALHKWKKTKKRVDAVSSMAYADGKIYVAGLSNEEFASTMRVIPFPFSDSQSASSLEIFHGAHGKYETHSPVSSFLPYQIAGKHHILAAYLCTPLVVFRSDQLTDGANVKGRTIAELGNGNYPMDMVAYQNKGKNYVLVINSARAPMRLDADELNATKENITTEASPGTGMPFVHTRGQGIQRAEAFGDENLLLLARGPQGNLELSTVLNRYF